MGIGENMEDRRMRVAARSDWVLKCVIIYYYYNSQLIYKELIRYSHTLPAVSYI